MEKINILFLMLSLNVGGTERHVLNLASHLNREKFNPVICCLHDLGVIGTQFARAGGSVKVCSNLIRSKFDLSGIRRGLKLIKDEKIHILYTINSPLTQLWGTVLSKLAGTEAFLSRVATTKPRFHAKRRIIANKIMLPFVDKVIAQADTHKKYLIQFEGMKEEKIEVVYNGVELERFNVHVDKLSLKGSLGIDADDPVIGIVARLATEKGHAVFLRAAKKVIRQLPRTRFLIVGDGEERQKMKDLSRELEIDANVFFLGTRQDIPQLLSIIDIAVLSSNSIVETVSNAVLEYMAAGKPVIATDSGSTAEMVIDGETGFVIPVGDYDALASAALKLLMDKRLAERMGNAGRKMVEEKFTLQKMLAKYEVLFSALIKENKETFA